MSPQASYLAAGYKARPSSALAAGVRLLHSDKFRSLLNNFNTKNAKLLEITGSYADIQTRETYQRAVAAGDLTNQVACCRIFQQRTGQLSDKLVLSVEDARELDSNKAAQAARIARIIMSKQLLQPSCNSNTPEIQASFEPKASDNVSRETDDGTPQVVGDDDVDGNNEP